MGATCASGISSFTSNTSTLPTKILILGKQNTGKTYLLYCWKYGVNCIMSVEPTSHFNVETISSSSGHKYLVYDLAGNIGFRLRPFLEGTNGIIYMIETGDSCNFLNESEEVNIAKLLQERDLQNVPVLFVIRARSDIKDCLEDVSNKLGDVHEDVANMLVHIHEDVSNKLGHILEGRNWDIVGIRETNQEDVDRVLDVLEKLLSKSNALYNSNLS